MVIKRLLVSVLVLALALFALAGAVNAPETGGGNQTQDLAWD